MKYLNLTYPEANATVSLFDHGRKEAHVYISPSNPSETASAQLKGIAEAARKVADKLGLTPVFMRWLLSDPANQIRLLPSENICATSIIRQSPLDGSKGFLFMILEEKADFEQKSPGIWEDSRGYIRMVDFPAGTARDSYSLTTDALEYLASTLAERGASLLDHCLRTWFFVRDIDVNYTGVVKGRNDVFMRHGLTPSTHFIASTGIEGGCADPHLGVAFNAFADTRVSPRQISSLQASSHLNPTYEYGVAFERATAVDYADRRHLYVSGTASIDNRGEIVAPGDIKAQTSRMLENIEVLLGEGECYWEDVAHMTVYLRDIADYHTVKTIFDERFSVVPKAIVLAPVCRPGWLIETECMAVRKNDIPGYAAY